MAEALRLAERARGKTSPNPLVGSVLYKDDIPVGKGYHRGAGLPHAEIEALRDAGERARGADLYVTLEPCNHQGRTPPCSEAIIKAGVRRVFIGMRDPNPHVRGGGAGRLEEAGIEVSSGFLERECRKQNEAFLTFITQGRPFVILKTASTLDGKIATSTGDSKWITNERSRRYAHTLRSQVDAIMVGSGTALADDPRLTCRLKRGRRDPIRVIVDSRLSVPPTANVFQVDSKAPTWVATTEEASAEKARRLEETGAKILRLPTENGRVAIEPLLRALAARDVTSALLEGGRALTTSFLRTRLVDKAYFFMAPKIIGGDQSVGSIGDLGVTRMNECLRFERVAIRRFGDDVMIESYPAPNEPE